MQFGEQQNRACLTDGEPGVGTLAADIGLDLEQSGDALEDTGAVTPTRAPPGSSISITDVARGSSALPPTRQRMHGTDLPSSLCPHYNINFKRAFQLRRVKRYSCRPQGAVAPELCSVRRIVARLARRM